MITPWTNCTLYKKEFDNNIFFRKILKNMRISFILAFAATFLCARSLVLKRFSYEDLFEIFHNKKASDSLKNLQCAYEVCIINFLTENMVIHSKKY